LDENVDAPFPVKTKSPRKSPSPKKSPRRTPKIDFVALNKKEVRPIKVFKPAPTVKASPTRLDKVLKTKASPHRGAVNVNTNKPDSLYHNILYKKPNEKVKTPVREPEPIYSKQSTPEKHYIMQKETSP
jgi:hypothetical protein